MSAGHIEKTADPKHRPRAAQPASPEREPDPIAVSQSTNLRLSPDRDQHLLRAPLSPGRGLGPLQTGYVLQLQRVHGNRHATQRVETARLGESALQRTHAVIQRAPPTPDELRLQLNDADALTGFDQWRKLVPGNNFVLMVNGAGGRDQNNYDFNAASEFFKRKKLEGGEFARKQADVERKTIALVDDVLSRIDSSCKETDGTNRPGAAGNPPAVAGPGNGTRPLGVTSEGALIWETQYGQPWMTTEGHYKKIRDYLGGLTDAIKKLQSYKPFVLNLAKNAEIDNAIIAATGRINAMRPALDDWNQRSTKYPLIWEANGKPKAVPPLNNAGVSVPDWPKETGPMVY